MSAQAMAQTPGLSNANSATGRFVLMDPLSGPTGSPLGGETDIGGNATFPGATGGLSTGIGFGPRNSANSANLTQGLATIPASQISGNTAASGSRDYIDDLLIGARAPWQVAVVPADSCMVYIGGGRSNAPLESTGLSVANPYTAGTLIGGFGNGGSRDGGAGPAFTGFAAKIVTATAGVAAGAVIEAGFVNRTGGAMLTGQSTFGSAVAATAAPV